MWSAPGFQSYCAYTAVTPIIDDSIHFTPVCQDTPVNQYWDVLVHSQDWLKCQSLNGPGAVPSIPVQSTCSPVAISTPSSLFQHWHTRLGHISPKRIQAKSHLVKHVCLAKVIAPIVTSNPHRISEPLKIQVNVSQLIRWNPPYQG